MTITATPNQNNSKNVCLQLNNKKSLYDIEPKDYLAENQECLHSYNNNTTWALPRTHTHTTLQDDRKIISTNHH